MGFWQKIFSGGAATLVKSVGGVLDDVITTKEEKLTIEMEIKKAEMAYEMEIRKLSVEEKRMYLDDTASARTMAAEVQKSEHASGLAKNISPILAILTTILTFVLFYLVIFRQDLNAVEDKKEIIIYILGALSAIVTQIFSFYFGSSQGSSDKNSMIQRQMEGITKK